MNTAEKLEILKEASRNGNADATNDLAVCYLTGDGVEKNAEIALKLFEQAAEKDCAIAQNNLAILYRDGADECEPDPNKYLYYLDLAIQNGYSERTKEFVEAAIRLATSNNVKMPYEWLRKAEMCALPYAEDAVAPFLYVFCILRKMRLIKYMGLDEDHIFLDNPEELSQLCKEFFRNAENLKKSSVESEKADAQTWIKEISQGVYQTGLGYLKKDQDEKALCCFEIVENYIPEAVIWRAVAAVSQAAQSQKAPDNPIYSRNMQTLLHIAVHENEVSDTKLYADACHMLALMYRFGLGTVIDINRSYEFESKAAFYGNTEANTQLKCYKKKLFGGYTFKGNV